MAQYDYDLFVIGAGSGGVRASRLAGAMGKKVAIAESYRVGGTCVIRGCVPKKLMVYASEYAHYFEEAKGYNWQMDKASFDWQSFTKARDTEIDRLNGLYLKTLQNNNVELMEGAAKFIDAHTVEVAGQNYTAEHILIATGGWPFMPDIEGIEHALTSNEIFHMPQLPQKLTVVGGGFVALEFAGIFQKLGVDVTLIYRGDQFLRGFDSDIRQMITEATLKNMDVKLGCNVTAIHKQKDGQKQIMLDNGESFDTDEILMALGRKPNFDGLGLEAINIKKDEKGFIKVDKDFKTSIPHIGAVGDVIDSPALTPVALREAMAWIGAIYESRSTQINYEFLPSAVFSDPNVATAGYSEEAAKEKFGDDIDVYISRFRPMIHTLSGRDSQVMLKLIVQKSTDRVLGVHMVGHEAGEVVQGLAIALTAGATKADFNNTIGIHPTIAEDFTFLNSKKQG